MRALTSLVAGAALLSGASAALAQVEGDAERGLHLARAACDGCHVVEPEGRGSDAVPPFATIAERPQTTRGTIRGALINPHAGMPPLGLTEQEIVDLLAYFATFNDELAEE